VLAALDFPKIEGRDAAGRASSDVYLRRQDGRVLEEILDLGDKPPKYLYLCARPSTSATDASAACSTCSRSRVGSKRRS